MNRIAFIGLGYIGLPTAVAMAQSGSEVVGVDVSREKIEQINNGRSPIVAVSYTHLTLPTKA